MQEWDGIPNDGHIPSWSGNPLFDEFAVSDGVNRARMRANRGCLGGRTGRKGRVATHLIEGFGLKSAMPLVNRVSRAVTSVRKSATWVVIFNTPSGLGSHVFSFIPWLKSTQSSEDDDSSLEVWIPRRISSALSGSWAFRR